MRRNSKVPARGVARTSQHKKQHRFIHNTLTQPGTALTAFLKGYKSDLLLHPYNNHISRLVDCCDFILDEVDRQDSKGVKHGC